MPTILAQWPQAAQWYVRETHGLLPRNTVVCQAVIELLRDGTTRLLPTEFAANQTEIVEYSEWALKLLPNCKIRWDTLPLNEQRDLLEPTISPAFAAACRAS